MGRETLPCVCTDPGAGISRPSWRDSHRRRSSRVKELRLTGIQPDVSVAGRPTVRCTRWRTASIALFYQPLAWSAP